MQESVFLLGFKPGVDILGPRSLDPRWMFPVLTRLGVEKFGDTRRVIFPPNPHHYSGLAASGAANRPSRRQIRGRSSVRRWFGAVGVPPGSQSFHFPVLCKLQAGPIILAYVKACIIGSR